MQPIFYICAGVLAGYYGIAFFMERRRIMNEILMRRFLDGVDYFIRIEMAREPGMAEKLAADFESVRDKSFEPAIFQQGFSWAQDFAHDNAEWTVSGMRVAMPRDMKTVRKYFRGQNAALNAL